MRLGEKTHWKCEAIIAARKQSMYLDIKAKGYPQVDAILETFPLTLRIGSEINKSVRHEIEENGHRRE